jgi:hypothetical protein
MNLPQRISLLKKLGDYMRSSEKSWLEAQEKASLENGWFINPFLQNAIDHIATNWLQENTLYAWMETEGIQASTLQPKKVGLVLAGNIPLVGFHDWLSVFILGHHAVIKPSSKDKTLLEHLLQQIIKWEPSCKEEIVLAERLTGCDAFIATGSNNSSRYFDYYFGKYPHLIRKNKTSAAVLTGQESLEELKKLATDIHLYFGLGCRNVTKLYVPAHYDFIPLLEAGKDYSWLSDHHKYKNNYDYNLALYILNKQLYMTNGTLLLIEDKNLFAPVSQLNYEYYTDLEQVNQLTKTATDLQALIGHHFIPFGKSQAPQLTDYADGANTIDFLSKKMLN